MRKIYLFLPCLVMTAFSFLSLSAQNIFFTRISENQIPAQSGKRLIIPERYQASALDTRAMRSFLWSLPSERNLINRNLAPVLELPMPNGNMAKFRVWETVMMEPALAAKFPGIKTFAGQGIDDPTATVYMDWTPQGFHAMILSDTASSIFIDPYRQADISHYTIYAKKDLAYRKDFYEEVDLLNQLTVPGPTANREMAGPCTGTTLRTYRLALACTFEYATFVSLPGPPDLTETFAAMTTSMNRVNGVYEKEVAVRMVLVANNNLIIFLTSDDPYTNSNGSTMLGQNQRAIDSLIGLANYDIGHVFSTGGGGVAGLGVPCGLSKARGVTGSFAPVGDAFDIDFVAHEMGHQFNASHTFNAITSNCGGSNRSGSTAVEPGSGITIMGYAGICGSSNNLANNSIDVFHAISFDQISTFISNPASGGSCAVSTPTGNLIPIVTAGADYTIPLSTPFVLTGSATDANGGDVLTYSWEQTDAGPAGSWNEPSGNAPLFRSFLPTTAPVRYFPKLSDQINNTTTIGEILPSYARNMNFRLTARDNRAGGGGVCFDEIQMTVAGNSGPFVVTVPSASGISWPAGTTQTVTWNVANTTSAPVSCANVSIQLSTDGGNTFPITVIASTPNDGSEQIVIPNNVTTQARIRVMSVGNVFYDMSNNNFTITAAVSGFDFQAPAPVTVSCPPPTPINFTINTTSNSGFVTPVTLTAPTLPAGVSASFSPNPVVPGNSTVLTLTGTTGLINGTHTITVSGTAGAVTRTVDLTLNVSTGAAPAISQQPQPQQVCESTNATFTAASPAALSYQWQVSTNGGGLFSNIAGASGSSLTVTNVPASANNNLYRVIIRGQCKDTTSETALLTVFTAPVITVQPASDSLCIGSDAVFSVTATGTNLSYQWQQSTDGGTSFSNIAAAISSQYTVNDVDLVMNGYLYRAIISGTCTPADTSDVVRLTVISPATIATDPAPMTVCETETATFTVTPGPSIIDLIYQWQVSTDGGANYSNLNNGGVYGGVNTATLTITGVTANLNNNLYRVLVSNAICSTPAASAGALLTANVRPTITLTANPTNILPGQTTLINAAIQPTAAGFNITWYRDNTVIPFIGGISYLVDSVEVGNYKVGILNPATGCSNESAELTITTSASERLFIFPNPNSGQFTVSYFNSNSSGSSQQTIAIYDARGARVYTAKRPVNGPYTLHHVNIRGVASGIYLVVIGDANGKRLAKEKIFIHY